MFCEECLQTNNAIQILQGSDAKKIQQLFCWIYKTYYQSFLHWILYKFSGFTYQDKLLEDAKDAFQNGLIAFFIKTQKNDFKFKGSLKSIIFSFGLLQLQALLKKEKCIDHEGEHIYDLDKMFVNNMDDDLSAIHIQNEQDHMKAILDLTPKERKIILLKFFKHLRSKQISEKLHVTVGDIDNTTGKAYKHLRASLLPTLI